MTAKEDLLTIGQVAQRAGVSIPTLRYYEQLGLLNSTRNTGNQRRYPRYVLRRLAFIAAAQRVGQSLEEIAHALGTLPEDKAPTRSDWTKLSTPWRKQVARRIQELQALQNTLDGCIGCGCLSLTRCAIFNPGDDAALEGAGSRWLRNAQDL
jgi:MerR family redox-sensitive transcriptional activator SoxR